MKILVRLTCRDRETEKVLKSLISKYKWDTRDAAQSYGISRIGKILINEDHLDYYVSEFNLEEESG